MSNNELTHHGILGMKWGKRNGPPYPLDPEDHSASERRAGWRKSLGNNKYKAKGIRGRIEAYKNRKTDESFRKWKEGSENREKAIEAGKRLNEARARSGFEKTDEVKALNKEYKRAMRQVTTYRKGQVKNQVGSDLASKYLSEAKRVAAQLENDPYNRELRSRYDKLITNYNIERGKASRAESIYANRSQQIASVKRGITMTVKAAATSAVIAGGAYMANKYGLISMVEAKELANNLLPYINKGRRLLGF